MKIKSVSWNMIYFPRKKEDIENYWECSIGVHLENGGYFDILCEDYNKLHPKLKNLLEPYYTMDKLLNIKESEEVIMV